MRGNLKRLGELTKQAFFSEPQPHVSTLNVVSLTLSLNLTVTLTVNLTMNLTLTSVLCPLPLTRDLVKASGRDVPCLTLGPMSFGGFRSSGFRGEIGHW